MGVEVFVNHSTETNIQGTVSVIERFSEVYNNSPLAKRHELQLLFFVWISKLRGTYGDHANNVKKGNRIFKEMKDSKRDLLLGVVQLQLLPSEVLLQLLWKSKEGLVEKAGGLNAWEALSEAERSASEARVLDDVARELGVQQYAAMSPEEQKMCFGPWIMGGCYMHKNLNSTKGGMKRAQTFWGGRDDRPILMPNKDNAALLDIVKTVVDTSSAATNAATQARETSNAGSVHAAMLGGLICNHKDNKKGQQDNFTWYFETHLGKRVAYPNMSNMRYQSYCEVAKVILQYRDTFISFMEYVRDFKDSQTFTNLKLNFYRCLTDPGTLTEFCILACESQAFGRPYMHHVCATRDVNLLDLGDIHQKMLTHYGTLRDNLDLLIGPNATASTGTFDESKFDHPKVMQVVKDLIPTLPAFCGAFEAYLEGALETMTRFSSEFVKGGVVDQLTPEERKKYFMHATNDLNEGWLGCKRVQKHYRPHITEEQSNARYMYQDNQTEVWAKRNLREDDHVYVRREARSRQKNAGAREKEMKMVHVTAKKAGIEKTKKKKQKMAGDKKRREDAVLEARYMGSESEVNKLNLKEIQVQLNIHRIYSKDTSILMKKNSEPTGGSAGTAECNTSLERYWRP